jgi:hypothetical protein
MSVEPMPDANVPSAPIVVVCESAQTTVIPARDALFFAPLAQLFGEFRALDVLVRDEVVGRDHNLRRVEDLVDAQFFEHLHGGRGGHVVRDDQVDLRVDDLAGHD